MLVTEKESEKISLEPEKSLVRLIWLFPILYLIHDIEEIMTVESFLRVHSDLLPFSVSTLQFTSAFIMLWVVATIGCWDAAKNRPFLGMAPATFVGFLIPGILLANGVGHVMQAIYFQSYVPGILTSILIIFPYGLYTLKYLLNKRMLTPKKFFAFFLLGFVIQGPLAFVALFLSDWIR